MLILSNCLSEQADEGCLKVAGSLIKRMKQKDAGVVVTYERELPLSDAHLELNKWLLSRKLIALLRQQKTVLYLPFPSRPFAQAVRIWMLSRMAPGKVYALLTMTARHGILAKWLLKWSGAHLIVLSRKAADYYGSFIRANRIICLKTGVDTRRFCPVTPERVVELKTAYGFDPARPVVLHVGHLKPGRNVSQLKKLSGQYQVLLVVSTQTRQEQDPALREELLRAGVRIMDGYLPEIQEIYQLADVYFFPVVEEGNCIDVPLSVLEAAACGKPVVATDFGEMNELMGKDSFYPIMSFDEKDLNDAVAQALHRGGNIRQAVLDYDWDYAVDALLKLVER